MGRKWQSFRDSSRLEISFPLFFYSDNTFGYLNFLPVQHFRYFGCYPLKVFLQHSQGCDLRNQLPIFCIQVFDFKIKQSQLHSLRYNDSFSEKWGSYILGKRLKFTVNHAWFNILHCGKCQGQVRKAMIHFLCHKSVFSKQHKSKIPEILMGQKNLWYPRSLFGRLDFILLLCILNPNLFL